MLFETLVGAASILSLCTLGWIHWLLRRATPPRPRPKPPPCYPSVTLIHPIKGLDAQAERNIRAAFGHRYPGELETIFVFDDETEPAVPLVERVIGEGHPAQIVYAGTPPANRTGKLNAMIAALPVAQGELVAFVDSDTRPGPLALEMLVTTLLESPKAGSAFAPVVATARPRTVGDAGYTLLLNGLYAPAAALATRRNRGTMPFIMGQFMVFHREALAGIGGLECAEGQLVDDMYLGRCIHEAGLENRVSPERVPIIERGLRLKEFLGIFVRWIAFSRTGLAGWTLKRLAWYQATMLWGGCLAAALGAALGLWWATAFALLLPFAVTESIHALHLAVGGAPLRRRHRWVPFGLIMVAPVMIAIVHFRHRVSWRGRDYPLDRGSRLAKQH